MNLYDRMTTIDKKIEKIVLQQEYLLKEVVNNFIGMNNKFCISQLFLTQQHFEILNQIFHGTVNLKSELDRYRLCCNKLILIEDERNTLG